jgi:hypothetical protein
MIGNVSERGQEQAAWNRATPGGWDERGLCAWCRDAFHHIDLITLSQIDDPYEGAEPMILIGGEWLHTPDYAERAARAATPAPEREAKAEPAPRPAPTWLYGTALIAIGAISSVGL